MKSALTPQDVALRRFQAPFRILESCRPPMKEGEVRKLTKRICHSLTLVIPTVQFLDPATDRTLADSGSCAYYCPGSKRLVFGPNGRNRWMVLHELAHHATDSYMGPHLDAHGAQFAGVLIFLASRYWTIPGGALDYVFTYPPGWESIQGYVNDWSYKGTEFSPRKHVPLNQLWQMAKECELQADPEVERCMTPWNVSWWEELLAVDKAV